MTWEEAVEIAASSHPYFRWLCSDDNPDPQTRAGYRQYVVRLVTGEDQNEKADPETDRLRAMIQKWTCCPLIKA